MNKIATRANQEIFPIDNPKRIEVSMQFSNAQFSLLKKGLSPKEMEDKWFIFYENDWLYFHRSWTGFGMYKAQLKKLQKGYCIDEFWAERNQEKYQNVDDDSDIAKFSFLIERGLLGIDAHYLPLNKSNHSENDSLNHWGFFGNLMFTEPANGFLDDVRSAFFGLAVGDAVGVPVEFKSRGTIRQNPVTDMTGYETHNQPPGTWSDDSSLAFCLAEALTQDFDLNTVAANFQKWFYKNYWTARGKVFDIGVATQEAIARLKAGTRPDLAGGFSENKNGNGSLMRILPLVFFIKDNPLDERFQVTKAVSSITHGHIQSVISCFYYLEFARKLLEGEDKLAIYKSLQKEVTEFLQPANIESDDMMVFDRLLKGNIQELPEEKIRSSGYVLDTLEASIWCLLTTETYKDAVLRSVNLGEDTDTTGAVTGGLAGLLYGFDNIPENWIKQLARRDDIEDLANRFAKNLSNQ